VTPYASRVALLAVAALLLAGCGSSAPRFQHADAAQLLVLTRAIPGEGACAQARDIKRLQARAIALVNARRVPSRLQDSLMSGVNALTEQAPVCLPSVPAATPTPPQAPGNGHGHHGKHGKRGEGD
jgi:hypothetical protein